MYSMYSHVYYHYLLFRLHLFDLGLSQAATLGNQVGAVTKRDSLISLPLSIGNDRAPFSAVMFSPTKTLARVL